MFLEMNDYYKIMKNFWLDKKKIGIKKVLTAGDECIFTMTSGRRYQCWVDNGIVYSKKLNKPPQKEDEQKMVDIEWEIVEKKSKIWLNQGDKA
jgi:hypothetical protein